MKLLWIAVIGLLATTASTTAFGQRVPLDDSMSPQQSFTVDLQWAPQHVEQALGAMLADQDTPLPPLTGYIPGIEIRLDTSRYVGRRGRIFMSVPIVIAGDTSAGALEIDWQARGAFLAGSMRPGQEALIFEGLLDARLLSGTFDFVISMASSSELDTFSLELRYELEIID